MLEEPVVCETHMQWLSGIDSCEPLDARGEVVIGIRPIHYPPAFAFSPARSKSKTPVIFWPVRVFYTDEMKFCFWRERMDAALIPDPEKRTAERALRSRA